MRKSQPDKQFDPDRLQRIDQLLNRYVEDGRSAGMSAWIFRRGELVHSALSGYQDIESKTRISRDTIFRIYSMTKPVASEV